MIKKPHKQSKAMSNRMGEWQNQKHIQPQLQEVRQVMEYQDAECKRDPTLGRRGDSSTLHAQMKPGDMLKFLHPDYMP